MASDVESNFVTKFQRLNWLLMLMQGINGLKPHQRWNFPLLVVNN